MSDEILMVQEVANLVKVADKTPYTMAQRGLEARTATLDIRAEAFV